MKKHDYIIITLIVLAGIIAYQCRNRHSMEAGLNRVIDRATASAEVIAKKHTNTLSQKHTLIVLVDPNMDCPACIEEAYYWTRPVSSVCTPLLLWDFLRSGATVHGALSKPLCKGVEPEVGWFFDSVTLNSTGNGPLTPGSANRPLTLNSTGEWASNHRISFSLAVTVGTACRYG